MHSFSRKGNVFRPKPTVLQLSCSLVILKSASRVSYTNAIAVAHAMACNAIIDGCIMSLPWHSGNTLARGNTLAYRSKVVV